MAVLKMQKVQILGMRKDLKGILKLIQEKAVMQVEDVQSEVELEAISEENHNTDFQIAELDFAIKFLSDHAPTRKIWEGRPSHTIDAALKKLKCFDHQTIINACKKLEEDIVADQNAQNTLVEEAALLTSWKKLPFDLNIPRETDYIHILIGLVSAGDYEEMKKEICNIGDLNEMHKVNEDGGKVYFTIVIAKSQLDKTKAVLNTYKFQTIELPYFEGTVKDRLKDIKEKLEKIEEKLEKHQKEKIDLAKHSDDLKVVHDVLSWQDEENETRAKLKGGSYSFVIEGWIAKVEIEDLKTSLHKISENVAIENIKAKKGEEAPIKLRNKKVAWPFESVTTLYGFPTASEVDPTPFLASFFIVFFALCLTDSGYGLLLFGSMFLFLKFFKLPEESKGLVKLLMWGGILTMIAGIFFGGYFGMTPEQAPGFLVSDGAFKFQLVNATSGNGPLTFLVLAMVIGIAHVLFGKLIDGWWKMKQGDYLDAVLDSFLWVAYILALLGFGLSSVDMVIPASLSTIFMWLALGGTAAMILTQGRKQETLAGKAIIGVLSLYGLVGYFGDVLSYSRIMALGLGTGIIAFAVNTIAGLAIDLIPYVGFLFAGLVLLVGHLMNLLLSALGAFIHSARLQFVEFFGKFMEGGGLPFKPFKRHCKYITLN